MCAKHNFREKDSCLKMLNGNQLTDMQHQEIISLGKFVASLNVAKLAFSNSSRFLPINIESAVL